MPEREAWGGVVNYPAYDIQVLDALQAIRKRPRMYVGDLDDPELPTRMLQQALGRSLSTEKEHLCVVVNHNGSWGISQDTTWDVEVLEKETKERGRKVHRAELFLTDIHAGSLTDEIDGRLYNNGLAYAVALSSESSIIVAKDGFEWHQKYEKSRATPWSIVPGDSARGTYLWFKLDETILPQREVNFDRFLEWLKAEKPEGLKVTARDERVGRIVELT